MQFTVIFYCKIAIFDPSPEKFRACGALFGGRCAPGPAAPDPPSIEHPRQPLHLVATPGMAARTIVEARGYIIQRLRRKRLSKL